MSRKSSAKSYVHEVSPVSRRRDDLSTALEVLNASVDSRMMHDALEEESPQWKSRDNSNAVLLKCRSVIDDLQYELEEERRRSSELETVISALNAEIDSEKEKSRQDRLMLEKVRKEKQSVLNECGSQISELESEVESLTKRVSEKDRELENMTKYCEKRVGDLKKAIKEASSVIATPPIPVDDSLIQELKSQLSASSAAIRAKDEECQSIVESYEKQVRMLRQQLKSSEDLIDRFVSKRREDRPVGSITTPSPQLDPGCAESSTQLFKQRTARPLNPFTIYN